MLKIKWCIEQLMNTDAGKGFIHESFNKDNPSKYSRDWFAWQNTLFGELIVKLIDDGKLNVLLSAQVVTPHQFNNCETKAIRRNE